MFFRQIYTFTLFDFKFLYFYDVFNFTAQTFKLMSK